jgi:hypothetical protein
MLGEVMESRPPSDDKTNRDKSKVYNRTLKSARNGPVWICFTFAQHKQKDRS